MTQPPLIAVDIGNSSTKIGLFEEYHMRVVLPQPKCVWDFPTGTSPPDDLIAGLPRETSQWRVASVNREGQRVVEAWAERHRPGDSFQVLTQRDLPIAVSVENPDRVGVDRLAAALAAFGANSIRDPGRASIVIAAGSALTVNFVSAEGVFEGGAILPGFRMQAEALFQNADMLPLAHLPIEDEPPPIVGKNTEQAIQSGLFWGAVGAARELIARMSESLTPPPQVFVTGGDLRRLAPLLDNQAKFVPNMVLAGIAIAARHR
jgi:type III pantothenate kinase